MKLRINDAEFNLIPVRNELILQAGGIKVIDFEGEPTVPRRFGKNTLELKVNFRMDGTLKTISRSSYFQVVNEDKISNYDNLRIITDSMIYVQKDLPFGFSVYMVNDSNMDKFVVMKKFEMIIKRDDEKVDEFTWTGERRAYVPANSKRILFRTNDWKTIQFDQTGDYRISIKVSNGKDELSYEFNIKVLSP